jgi:hypothetical protein
MRCKSKEEVCAEEEERFFLNIEGIGLCQILFIYAGLDIVFHTP